MLRLATLVLCASLLVACKNGNNDRCVNSSDCKAGEGCYALPTGAQRCLPRCNATDDVFCATGELCVSVPGEDAADDVCLPGGTIPHGAACTSSAECTKGGMCFTVGEATTCRRACDLDGAPTCLASEACVSLDPDAGVMRGICVVP
jgi:hypothetical protein